MLALGWMFFYSVFTFFVVLRLVMQPDAIIQTVVAIRLGFLLIVILYVIMILHRGSTVSRQVLVKLKLIYYSNQ